MKPLRTLITLLLLGAMALAVIAGAAGARAQGQAETRVGATVVAQLLAMQDPVSAPRTNPVASSPNGTVRALAAMLEEAEAPAQLPEAPQPVAAALHALLAAS